MKRQSEAGMSPNRAKLKLIAPKQARFAAEYIIDRNGPQAAIRAGYSQKYAYAQANRRLKYTEVRAAVDRLEDELGYGT